MANIFLSRKTRVSLVWALQFAPNTYNLVSAANDRTIRWRSLGGNLEAFTLPHANVAALTWTSDSKTLYSAGKDGIIHEWDMLSRIVRRRMTGHEKPVWSVALSPDGRFLASGGYDNKVIVWDANSGKMLQTFSGHTGWILSVVWSPDGKRIVSAGFDKTVRVWNVHSGKQIAKLTGKYSTKRLAKLF